MLAAAPPPTPGCDSQLSLTANITATTSSCRFMLHSIRRTRPLLTHTPPLPPLVTSSCLHLVQNTSIWYRAVTGSGPVHIQDMVQRYSPFTPLCIDQSDAPSLRGTAVTQHHHHCLMSWLGGTSSTWTWGQDVHMSSSRLKTLLFRLHLGGEEDV